MSTTVAVKAAPVERASFGSSPLPDYGLLYFHHLHAELRSIPPGRLDADARAIADEILRRNQEGSLCWDDLYAFDLMLVRLLPPERLPRKVWSLRLRYRDIVDLQEYEAYLASKPPSIADSSKDREEELRADIEYLMGQIYLRYSIGPFGERIRDRVSKRVAIVTLFGIGAMGIVFGLNLVGVRETYSAALPTALFAGAMGGLLSLQQRYQGTARHGDPVEGVSQLAHNWPQVFLPAINGAVFALVLYMLMLGGLISGDIFPRFMKPDENQNGLVLLEFLRQGKPANPSDYAKLIVWCFVAGFAERFVPDTLSRLVARTQTDKKPKQTG
jgi:hypothetical protein